MAALNLKNQTAKMAGSQQGLSTPKGKIITFDDVNAIFESVDSGQPFQIHITSDPDDHSRTKLQIRNCTEVSNDATSNNTKHIGKPYEIRSIVEQLQSLDLTDEEIVEQILTSPQPAALSKLTAAHNNKSILPLVTAEDGRAFSIMAGQLPHSKWCGKYPMEFSQSPVRKLSDPALKDDKITTYQKDALMKMIDAVRNTKVAHEFSQPVLALQPKIWVHYKAQIPEPIDLETMHSMLFHNRYATMADFWRHVDLLEQNARTFNNKPKNKWVVKAAIKVKNDIYRRMDGIPAEPPLDGEAVTQIRQIIYAIDFESISAASSNNGEEMGADGDENQDVPHGEADGSEPEDSTLVLPLGRLCVVHEAGGDEVTTTPYIVVMDIESPRKSLWLVKDNYIPVGLPSDKRTLLDFGGKYNFTVGMLARDINDWETRESRGPRGAVKSTKFPTLSWTSVKELIGQSSQDGAVLLDLVENQQAAAADIKKGWDVSRESGEEDEENSNEDFDGNDTAAASHGGRKRGFRPDAESKDDGTNGEHEPPRKMRTRSAARARLSSGIRR